MLDLDVVPERSLGNEQWEFVLGKRQKNRDLVTDLISDFLSPFPFLLLLRSCFKSGSRFCLLKNTLWFSTFTSFYVFFNT